MDRDKKYVMGTIRLLFRTSFILKIPKNIFLTNCLRFNHGIATVYAQFTVASISISKNIGAAVFFFCLSKLAPKKHFEVQSTPRQYRELTIFKIFTNTQHELSWEAEPNGTLSITPVEIFWHDVQSSVGESSSPNCAWFVRQSWQLT